eukprot:scpid97647/ scgid25394/ 
MDKPDGKAPRYGLRTRTPHPTATEVVAGSSEFMSKPQEKEKPVQRAKLAVRAFYSPFDTATTYTSKYKAATAFNISRQLFRHVECAFSDTGVLEWIKSGELPPP